jgi:hypothetical protein
MARALPESYERRLRWLAQHTQLGTTRLEVQASADEVRHRMFNATKLPPGKGTATYLPRAQRKEAFVTGGFVGEGRTFRFTGYREREWLPVAIDPDKMLKPRLVGEIEGHGPATAIIYRIDARSRSRLFFSLASLAILFASLGAVIASLYGVPVPGPAFFSFLLAGVCVAGANNIWVLIPKAQADEAFLTSWLEKVFNLPTPPE